MKKSLLTFGAVCMMIGGMSASSTQLESASPFRFDGIKKAETVSDLTLPRPSKGMWKAPAKVGKPGDVITEVSGKRQNITITGSGFFLYYGTSFQMYRDQNLASHMVYGDNNEVYIYNILPNTGFEPGTGLDTYVKGVKEDDRIVVDLPQTVYSFDDGMEGFNLAMLKWDTIIYEGAPTEYYVYDEEATTLTIHIEKDGSMWADIPEGHLLGLVYSTDNWWASYGVYDLSMVNFDEEMVTLPEGYGVVEDFWWYNTGIYGYPVAWAPGDSEWYLRGLCQELPDSWIKGTVSPDDPFTIGIEQDQYIGIYVGYYMWTKAIKLEFDEKGSPCDAELMPDDYVYELIWDPVNNTVTPKDKDVYLAINAAKKHVEYLDAFINFNLVHQTDFAGTPKDPFDLNYFITSSMLGGIGYDMLRVMVPSVSTEGTLLNTDDLYYVVYLDDEPWTFEPDEYGTESPIEEIPWNLDLPHIAVVPLQPAMRVVDIFVEGFSTIGVQSVYRHDGVETRSRIVSGSIDPSGVEEVASGRKVSGVQYFDLSGRKVVEPTAGIYVKHVTYDDGTTAVFKTAVR